MRSLFTVQGGLSRGCLSGKPSRTESPSHLWTRQTPVKILPCPKLHLLVVKFKIKYKFTQALLHALCDRFGCATSIGNLATVQGPYSDWKTWKSGKAFSTPGKIREITQNTAKVREFLTNFICHFCDIVMNCIFTASSCRKVMFSRVSVILWGGVGTLTCIMEYPHRVVCILLECCLVFAKMDQVLI